VKASAGYVYTKVIYLLSYPYSFLPYSSMDNTSISMFSYSECDHGHLAEDSIQEPKPLGQ